MGRGATFAVAAFGLLFASGVALAAETYRFSAPPGSLEIVRTVGGIEGGISQGPSRVGLRDRDGGVRLLELNRGKLAVSVSVPTSIPLAPRSDNILPHGEITYGTGGIARAWLTDPTERYAHGVLGDAIEAGGLALQRDDGRIARYKLDAGSVFEDRRVRLTDLDGDGRDEAIVVQSYLDAGAALAVFGLDESGVVFLSEVPAIGRANRWLNPVGAADFDGDGRTEVAFVETPHIGGTLRLYEFRDRKLHKDHAARGFSNHGIGSREQSQAAVHDWTGDGVADIAVPDARRSGIRFVTFAGGEFREFDAVAHRQKIVTAVRPAKLDRSGVVYAVYGLADGTIVAARPTPAK
ncbi:MAG: VCBS repeat-containing protein [Rhodospirillaceae bacterium]|nr:VCBS repeat-containing protein [Rhodospirillaceae bacterium]